MSVTAYYEYQTVIDSPTSPLHRSGEIQVESTSFTKSEPLENCEILPLIYKFANAEQRNILENNFEIKP